LDGGEVFPGPRRMTDQTALPVPQMQRSRGEAAVRLRLDGGRVRLVDLRQQWCF